MLFEKGFFSVDIDNTGGDITRFQYSGEDVLFPRSRVRCWDGHEKLRGTHFCAPIFGRAPQGSIYEKLPQHGWLRYETDLEMWREGKGKNTVGAKFSLEPRENYPWRISGRILYSVLPDLKSFRISVFVRAFSCGVSRVFLVPFNWGFHFYFVPKKEFRVCLGENAIRDLTVHRFDEFKNALPYESGKPVFLENFHENGSIEIETEGFGKGAMVYLWTDSLKYFCVEPVLRNHELFGKTGGLFLKPFGEEVSFYCTLKFS